MGTDAIVRSVRAVSRNRPLLRLEFAYGLWAIYELGIWVALLLWGYAHGGVAFAGTVAIAQTIPAALLAPLGGMFADRVARDVALRVGYVLQFVTTTLLAVLMYANAQRLAVLGVAVLVTVLIAWTRPPHFAATTELARGPGEAAAANSMAGTLERFGYFVGPLLAGIITAATSTATAVLIFAGLVFLSAVLLVGVRLGRPKATEVEAASQAPKVRLMPNLLAHPSVGVMMLVVGMVFMTEGCLELLAISFAHQSLVDGAGASGLLISAEGLGSVLGAFTTVILIKWRRLTPAVAGSLAACALPLFAFNLVHRLVTATALLAVVGVGLGFFLVAGITLLQRAVAEPVMARILSLRESALLAGVAAGAFISRFLVREFGSAGAYVSLGVLMIGVALISVPSGVRLDRRAVFRPGVVELLAHIEFLAVLDVASLERLANGAAEMHVVAGQRVVTQGDVGDSFYAVESGELEVSVAGQDKHVVLEGGSGFGEIALLRRVPRTATVTATTDCVLWRIDSALFLQTITGSTSHNLAERHVEVQLDRLSSSDEG